MSLLRDGPQRSMSLREMFNHDRKILNGGIEGYELVKKYEDPLAAMKSRESHKHKIRELKRGSYLEYEIRYRKEMPAVGLYELRGELSKMESKPRRKTEPHRSTYLDEILKQNKRNKVPPPGLYQVSSSLNVSKSRNTHKGICFGQRVQADKVTYLDNAEYEGITTPGVGYYNVPTMFRSKSEYSKIGLSQKPDFWREHHKKQLQKEREKLKTQGPSIGHYNPKHLAYELFEDKKKLSKAESTHRLSLRKSERFKTEDSKKSGLGPGKYEILHEWAPKSRGKRGILENISKGPAPSVYYK